VLGGNARARVDAVGRAAALLGVDEVAEARAQLLVTRRVDVCHVIGERVHSLLLGRHACGGRVQTF
jgi:hypothetical protein